VIHVKKRPHQRLFGRARISICGARSDTATADATQYSAASGGLSLSNTVLFFDIFGISEADPPFTTEFTRPTYSHTMEAIRNKL
jgi:hypothetical protein